MIKIALADDHQLFREGIRFLLDQMDNKVLVLEASDGDELISKLEHTMPDVVLLDLEMPNKDGVETLQIIRSLYPNLGVIILTTHNDTKMMAYLMELGANSYLLKDSPSDVLSEAIEAVASESFYFTEEVSKAMLSGLRGGGRTKPTLKNNERLTQRELEVLELICQEFTAKEIADKLFLSHRTVEGHRKNLIDKMGVRNTAGLIVKAIKEGIVDI